MIQTESLIDEFNKILAIKDTCIVNIVNDKLTLSVFSMLQKNLSKVKEINFILRDTRYIPQNQELTHEFEIDINEALFNSYDIVEKNTLKHFDKAKSMYDFIQKHVNVKKTVGNCQIKGNVLLVDNEFMIQGSSSLELSAKAQKSKINNVNFDSIISSNMDKSQIERANQTFNAIWNNPEYTENFKNEVLTSLEYLYKEHSPEFLYYYTLNDLFSEQLDYGVERFETDNMHFKNTNIWNMLFDFQKDAVLSAIQKIHKYNGCIIADSVGLGKTFEALAVIKYFELRQDNVLVLTPAKLYDNWNSFKGAYKDGFLEENFNYKIMFHTDLSRYKGESKSGYDLSRFDWGKYDLVVIDESHNFRNRVEKEEGLTRYQRLMQEVVKENRNTKVLLLSATPVNNSLVDLRNQISIITGDRDYAFKDYGIASVSNLLKQSSTALNQWSELQTKNKEHLYDLLPANFYKLLEMMTIARSRKHITTCYGTQQVGTFPTKLKPDTFTPHIDTEQSLLNFRETNMKLEELLLAVYMPMSYIKPEYKQHYREKYKTTIGGKDVFFHEDREFLTAKMHRFNLFKRLDSSVFAFAETIRRLIEKMDSYINDIERGHFNPDDENEIADNDTCLDYKYEIRVEHLRKADFLADLYCDKELLENIYSEAKTVLNNKRDNKLKKLKEILINKVTQTPYNDGNKKVIIFTAFADTSNYLFDSLKEEMKKHNTVLAMVSGSGDPRCNHNPDKKKLEFNNVLSRFSPKSKLKTELPQEQQIDVLIGTDCISEGQNLQDCDCVINYDIQWNPVSLIQRFGRIDRIGSSNTQIKMINFFPDIDLNEYLDLENRVKNKMVATNIVSTGDENLLSPELNDINFRKQQLEKLKDEVIDIDEAKDNISLTDLNLNDYLYELADYLKANPEIKKTPHGIYSVAGGENKGVIFCFKHKNNEAKPKNESSLYPYYLIFIGDSGEIITGNAQARDLLRQFRTLCYKKSEVNEELFNQFYSITSNVQDMRYYSDLLTKSIKTIQGKEDENAKQTIFSFEGFDNPFAGETQDDFELISFLVLK
jgi:ERCC4-related helicase